MGPCLLPAALLALLAWPAPIQSAQDPSVFCGGELGPAAPTPPHGAAAGQPLPVLDTGRRRPQGCARPSPALGPEVAENPCPPWLGAAISPSRALFWGELGHAGSARLACLPGALWGHLSRDFQLLGTC